jgi:TolB-like protein/DNA-binding winged helix-turn-helix (wHTH) protein/Tfp pilus assembly protein PilF
MIYKFNSFELDNNNFRLYNNGKELAVEPQVFNLIAYLLINRKRLVTRDEVFETLWAGRRVLDASLSNHIKSARAVLGDDGEAQNIIKTYRGRGYQFIALVEEEPEQKIAAQVSNNVVIERIKNKPLPNEHKTGKKTSRFISFGVTAAIIFGFLIFTLLLIPSEEQVAVVASSENPINENLSIAVLPFENRSHIAGDVYFTDGIHDDLLTQISKIGSIKTISRTSVMSYRDTTKNIRTIAKELGVATILEGGVQRAGNQIRINVQLIDAINDVHLWSETYTRELNVENIFAIQSEISKAVAAALEAVLTIEELHSLDTVPTQSMPALEAYFLANANADTRTSMGMRNAIEHQKRAIQLDPEFANAYAALASLELGQIYWDNLPAQTQIPKARSLIETAMVLNNKLSETYTALGSLKRHENDYDAATLAFQKAISLNPNNANAYRAHGEFYQDQLEDNIKAAEYLAKANELDPNSDSLAANLAQVCIAIGRVKEARAILENIMQRKPDFAPVYMPLGFLYFYVDGEIAQAQRVASIRSQLDPGAPVPAILFAWGYIHAGEFDTAIEWLRYSIQLSNSSQGRLATQALIYDLQGDYSLAFDTYIEAQVSYHNKFYRLMKTGHWANRTDEVIAFTKQHFPSLFTDQAIIDETNFSTALVLGEILREKGELKQGDYLLAGVLKIVQLRKYGWWVGRYNNWVAQCYLAMGNNKAALKAFVETAEEGYHSGLLITDPIYKPLYGEPEYQRVIKIIKDGLVKERLQLNEMEEKGEILLPSEF